MCFTERNKEIACVLHVTPPKVSRLVSTMASSSGLWTTVVPGVLYSVLPIQPIEACTQVNSVGRSVTFVTKKKIVHQSHRNSGNIQQ